MAGAVVCSGLLPSLARPAIASPRAGRNRARSGCCARRCRSGINRDARPQRARQRLQHAARAGARAAATPTSRRPRAARRRAAAPAGDLRSAGDGARRRARARACACTPGSTSTWSRARSSCRSRRDAHRPPPSRVADGAARPRAGAGARQAEDSPAYVGRLARWTRAQSTASRDSTPRRSLPEAAAHTRSRRPRPRRALRARRRAPRLRALSRPSGSTTAAARSREFRDIDPADAVAPRRAASSTRAERVDLLAYPDAFPDEWRPSGSRA